MQNKHTALTCALLLVGLSACTQEQAATAAATASAPAPVLPAVLLESRHLESRLSGEASETESAQSAAFAELLAGGRRNHRARRRSCLGLPCRRAVSRH